MKITGSFDEIKFYLREDKKICGIGNSYNCDVLLTPSYVEIKYNEDKVSFFCTSKKDLLSDKKNIN